MEDYRCCGLMQGG